MISNTSNNKMFFYSVIGQSGIAFLYDSCVILSIVIMKILYRRFAMRSDDGLTWQPQRTKSNPNAGRWRKMYQNRFHYFSGGRGKNDEQAYEEALGAWRVLKKKIDSTESSERQLIKKALKWILKQTVHVCTVFDGTVVASYHYWEPLLRMLELRFVSLALG